MSRLRSILRGLGHALYTSQEFTLWLPGMALLALAGYILIGAITPLTGDVLAWLSELPALCAYAAAALGCSWVIKRLYLFDLDMDTERTLHAAAESGDRNAQWVLIKDRLETLACIALSFAFFWPSR